ncbi:alpha/beta hydrolase [Belnapia sp. F-4-1]|uniref:alpha/beta hydrolase n=1 Tax=Belnapia sp. F-4-1 TaxID=1545443 RepID=UPI0005BDFF5E|nr:hypothetical protein [Belnapia sp. F-4-1]
MEEGRLAARPQPPGATRPWPLPAGLHPMGEAMLRVPASPGSGPLPLILMLHGAGGDPAKALRRVESIAEAALVLLPKSRGATWDVLEGGYGPDVARIDAALAAVFAAWPVDPARIAAAGFSDGASYALSLAMMNGALFTHALAFSPGFAAPLHVEGKPRCFLSHGTEDRVLNIDLCSRRLAPKLQRAGYPLTYLEFGGGHEVPEAIAERALAFLLED